MCSIWLVFHVPVRGNWAVFLLDSYMFVLSDDDACVSISPNSALVMALSHSFAYISLYSSIILLLSSNTDMRKWVQNDNVPKKVLTVFWAMVWLEGLKGLGWTGAGCFLAHLGGSNLIFSREYLDFTFVTSVTIAVCNQTWRKQILLNQKQKTLYIKYLNKPPTRNLI